MFFALHNVGMPSLDIIRAVTTNAAELLGWQDRVGAVEPGKFANLIATAGDPVADLSELERVGFVMNDGKVVRNTLPRVKAPALAAERPSAPRTPREGERLAQPILSMHEREIQAG